MIFGVGRGYHTREVETFGSPLLDQAANRELFEEQVDIIFKAFNNESFSHKGKHYTLPPEVPYRGYTLKELTLVPRPLRLPVECWQPIQGGTGARHGVHGQARHPGHGRRRLGRGRRDAQGRAGLAGGACQGRQAHRTRRAAVLRLPFLHRRQQGATASREAAKYYEENMKMFGELRLVRAMTDEQIEIMRDPKRAPTAKLPRIEDAVKAGGFLTGTPDEIIEHLKALEEKLSGAGPRLGQPVGRRAEVRGAGAIGAVRRRGDAGVQQGEGGGAGTGEVAVRSKPGAASEGAGPAANDAERVAKRSGFAATEVCMDQTLAATLTAWRRHLHAHPELTLQEQETAAFVCGKLTELACRFSPASAGTAWWRRCRAASPTAASGCAPTWTRCRSPKPPACRTPRPIPA